jgi:hypothetical protein
MENPTKEEQILVILASSGLSTTNKFLSEKFSVNEDYLLSLRGRIKSGNINLEQYVEQQNTTTATT